MKVDDFIQKNVDFKIGLQKLRQILLSAELEETIKWGMPTYCIDGKNLIGLGAFKSYFGLWFFQGALLTDKSKMLNNAQEGKTEAMRQWRFYNNQNIDETLVKSYIVETIKNHKSGKEITSRKKPLVLPNIFVSAIKNNKVLNEAFSRLNLTKQREFVDYISEAKREQTKLSRLEKIKPMILNNIGLHDKYR